MKIQFNFIASLILLTVFIFSMFSCNLSSTEKKDDNLPAHPRLFLQADDETDLIKNLSGNNYVAELSNVIIEASDKMIDIEPVIYEKKGKRLLTVSRICLKRVMFLSYSYRITKDIKYLERAEKEMLTVAAFENWNPSHFLDVAEMTAALGIGYDWLFHDLSMDTKKIIKEAIINKGFMPSKDSTYNSWLRTENNWNQVCNGGLALGAMAIYESEPELSQEIIERAINSMKIPLKEYVPDGAYPEGNIYWAYGSMYHVLFIDAYRSIYGEDEDLGLDNGFMQSAYFFLHMYGPTGSFNYSDGRKDNEYTPAIYWFASELKDNSILFNQKKLLKELTNNKSYKKAIKTQDRYLPLIPIWASRFENLDIDEPENKSWTGKGQNPVSFHRTSWNDDGIFIGVKGGSASLSHAHMDAGSFVMDAEGIRWAMDLGKHEYYNLESKGLDLWNREQDSERWTVLRYSNFFHSTLTVDNELQKVDANATIVKSSDNEQFRNTVLDISSAYSGSLKSALRGIAIEDNNHVIVRDEIINDETDANVRWAMLTHDNIEIVNDKLAIIRKDGKEIKFLVVEPENAKIQTYSTKPKLEFEDENPNTIMIGFEVNLKANEEETLKVLLVPGDNVAPEEVNHGKLEEW